MAKKSPKRRASVIKQSPDARVEQRPVLLHENVWNVLQALAEEHGISRSRLVFNLITQNADVIATARKLNVILYENLPTGGANRKMDRRPIEKLILQGQKTLPEIAEQLGIGLRTVERVKQKMQKGESEKQPSSKRKK
ncbi:MAG: hypothetical protein KDA91_19750 [Planctomycetaceae bacterium]|nr:hypothetical protein [Planctomycetaceae bacterium]